MDKTIEEILSKLDQRSKRATDRFTRMGEHGAKYAGSSSVWDIYNTGLTANKNSNLYKDLHALFQRNPQIEKVHVCAISKGRSQHAKSELAIFDVTGLDIFQGFGAEFVREEII